ncbi:UNVERIFIED_CONTAM: hypothetical protein FKN15_042178 [Acipenser sinensis]
MNTRCPPKRVPSAARFFTLCRLTVQPPQSYSIGGQHSSGQLTGKHAGARPDYRGRWCATNDDYTPCKCLNHGIKSHAPLHKQFQSSNLVSVARLTICTAVHHTTIFLHLSCAIDCGQSYLSQGTSVADHRVVDCGDVSVTLKSRDPRLQKSLSVGEFVLAFSIYRDILCSVYPHRLQELNQYLFLVVELAVRYGGALFYQYHRAFSAKAAATLSADNRIIDWSRSDTDLFTRIFSGIRPNACSACASTAHSSYLCPKTAASSLQPIHHPLPSLLSPRHLAPASIHASAPPTRSQARDVYGRPIKFTGGRQICNNFNTSACFSKTCKYLHACSFCNDAHSRSICPLSAK